MSTKSDPQLLREYAGNRSEAAFAELLRRHLDLVHSAALRITGDSHLAQDVSQGVFVALAQRAGKLAAHPVLSGWLHATTRNIAAQAIRTEMRRRKREQQAAAMIDASETAAAWDEIAPHLDAALSELADSDRDAVLLRYFENQSARDIAAVLGISAEAAQKRVNRGVEKLRDKLAKRGITAGAAGLTGAISARAVQAAPAGLAARVMSGIPGAAILPTTKILAMMTMKKVLGAAAVAMLATILIYQATSLTRPVEDRHTAQAAVSTGPKTRQGASLVEKMATARRERPPVDRKKELERLKKRWLETQKSSDPEVTAQRSGLAKESADLLVCSEEMRQLLDFLYKNNRRDVLMQISSEVEKLFNSRRAAEARKFLVGLPESVTIKGQRAYGGDGVAYRDLWSKAAGRTCPDAEFEAFLTALNCKSCAQEALYGRNLALMKVDAEAALQSTLHAYQTGIPSLSGSDGLRELFMIEEPIHADFAKLESMLPTTEPLLEVRYPLYRKWAETDPSGAVNHLMSTHDSQAPTMAGAIVAGCAVNNRNGIVSLVSTFPEGPYFDMAALWATTYAREQPGLLELVQKIRDPKIRAEAMEKTKARVAKSTR